MTRPAGKQLRDTNVREDPHEPFEGQLSFADERAMEAWVAEMAPRFVFAPALVVPVIDNARPRPNNGHERL